MALIYAVGVAAAAAAAAVLVVRWLVTISTACRCASFNSAWLRAHSDASSAIYTKFVLMG